MRCFCSSDDAGSMRPIVIRQNRFVMLHFPKIYFLIHARNDSCSILFRTNKNQCDAEVLHGTDRYRQKSSIRIICDIWKKNHFSAAHNITTSKLVYSVTCDGRVVQTEVIQGLEIEFERESPENENQIYIYIYTRRRRSKSACFSSSEEAVKTLEAGMHMMSVQRTALQAQRTWEIFLEHWH